MMRAQRRTGPTWVLLAVAVGCGDGGGPRRPAPDDPHSEERSGGAAEPAPVPAASAAASTEAAPREWPARPVDCLLDRLGQATVHSPLAERTEVPAHVVALADLTRSASMPGGRGDVYPLPLSIRRLPGGGPDRVELLGSNGQPVGEARVAPGSVRVPTYLLPAFAECIWARDSTGKPRPLVQENGTRVIEVQRFGIRGYLTCELFPPSGAREVEASDDPATWPLVRAFFGGNKLAETAVKPSSKNVLGFSLPSTPGTSQIELEFSNISRASPLSMAVMLSDLQIEESDGLDRVVVPGGAEAGSMLRYQPRLPEALQRFQRTPLTTQHRVLLGPGTVAVRHDQALPFRVRVDGEIVAEAGPGEEAAFVVDHVRSGVIEVESQDGELATSFWLMQPTALFRRELRGVRGEETPSDHPLLGHVMRNEETRRCLLAPPPTAVELPFGCDPGDELDLAFALVELGDTTLPQVPITVEVVIQRAEGNETLFHATLQERDKWIDLRLPLEVAADLGEARLLLSTRSSEGQLVFGQRTLVAIAEPRVLRRKLKRGPNLLIYLIDTLRADHLSCYGYRRKTTPRIDSFAEDAILFERAYSSAPWTRPAVASLFTGLLYSFHNAGKTTGLSPTLQTLAERLRATGYETAGFLANAHVHGASLNFEQGFSHFVGVEKKRGSSRASEVNEEVFQWLDRHGDRPFFLYVHTIDPHATYDPPVDTAGRFQKEYSGLLSPDRTHARYLLGHTWEDADIRYLVDLYDEEILFNDQEFGRLLRRLKRLDLYEDTIIVVISDHGEEFGEHGSFGHGNRLWEELIRVPLIVKLNGADRPRGVRVADPVRMIDVLPTVAERLQLEGSPGDFQGVDLSPWWSGGEVPLLDVIAEEEPHLRCLIRGFEKLIEVDPPEAGQPALYHFDLRSDPGEQDNLATRGSEAALRLRAVLREVLAGYERNFHRVDDMMQQSLSTAERDALVELGYLDS